MYVCKGKVINKNKQNYHYLGASVCLYIFILL